VKKNIDTVAKKDSEKRKVKRNSEQNIEIVGKK